MEKINFKVPLLAYIPVFVLFLVSPSLALCYSIFLVAKCQDLYDGKKEIFIFFFILASWLGFLNTTKMPASDQVAYLTLFLKADEFGFYNTVFNGINGGGTEFLYGLYTWLSHYLWGGNGAIFFFVTTVIIYMLHFIATYKIYEKMNLPVSMLLCGILTLAFFSQYFNLTNHLVRQTLAASIAIYGLSLRACGEKWWFLWFFAAPFVHTSSFLISAVGFIPLIYRRMNQRELLIVILIFCGILYIVTMQTNMSLDLNSRLMDRGFSRMTQVGSENEMKVPIYILAMIVIPIFWGAYQALKYAFLEGETFILPYCYVGIGLGIFVLLLSGKPLLQYRLFYYMYSFLPFLLPFIVSPLGKMRYVVDEIIPTFFIFRFLITFNHQAWSYASLPDILSMPCLYYFVYSPLNS